MKQDNPLALAGVTVVVLIVVALWWRDWQARRAGRTYAHMLPGAGATSRRAISVAVVGSLVLLACEVFGEHALGIVAEQSTMTVLFAVYTLAAAFGEELIFRGYLVVTGRGRFWLVASIVVFSALFALLHPFLWAWNDGVRFTLTTKALFSTGVLFIGSLWFYWVRFQAANPHRSLLPCFAAHLARNVGVIAVKAWQGFLVGWY